MKPCNLTPEEILKDLAYVVDLTGSETPAEIEHLHQSIYHSTDGDPSEFQFDEKAYEKSPTQKEMSATYKDKRREGQRCCICPPNKGENASRKAKHGVSKKLGPNKKQGREVKQLGYDENRNVRDVINKAGKRR